ncbi:MAG: AMP nucleosidase, partial [Parvibaculaceae bacterium]
MDTTTDRNATGLSPADAVARLINLHDGATGALKSALERYFAGGAPPSAAERAEFRYPELRLVYAAGHAQPSLARAYAKFESPGTYATTIAQPRFFRDYLMEQLSLLVADYPASIAVTHSDQEIPYPYVLDRGDDLAGDSASAAELARHFPPPRLSAIGDEIADGLWSPPPGEP